MPHGECNAILLDHVVQFNFDAEPDKYKLIGEALGLNLDEISKEEIKSSLVNKIQSLKIEAGVNHSLKDVGVTLKDIPELASKAMNDACIITNPRKPTQKDVEEIFQNAL